jgi:RNA-directed DNA polymerase
MELVEGKMAEAWDSESISTKQHEIAALAKRMPKRVLNTLAHRMDLAWMREAYRRVRKDGARGVDGVSARDYGRTWKKT